MSQALVLFVGVRAHLSSGQVWRFIGHVPCEPLVAPDLFGVLCVACLSVAHRGFGLPRPICVSHVGRRGSVHFLAALQLGLASTDICIDIC